MSGPRIGELFAGYGGLGMGVKAVLGGDVAWVSDIDKGACRVLAHRFPGVPNIGDITTVDWSSVEPVDVLTGGFPCQDVSAAGKRAGIRPGTRSGLWTHFAYAIDQLRPRLVVIENVRGLLSAEAHSDMEPCPWCVGDEPDGVMRALGAVLGDLASIGFDASWHGLRAADVGAPHGRFRVFIVAYPKGDTGRVLNGDDEAARHAPGLRRVGREAQLPRPLNEPAWDGTGSLLPSPRTSDTNGAGAHGGGGLDLRTAVAMLPTPTSRDHKGRNQRDDTTCLTGALLPTPRAGGGEKGGPNQRGSSGDLMLPSAVTHLLPTPAVNDMGEGKTVEAWDEWTAKMKAAHGNGNGHGASLAIEAQRLLPTPRASDGPEATSHARSWSSTDHNLHNVARESQWGQYADAIARWEALTRPAPPPTETGPKGNPRLSPAFSEWLMGLPAGWITDVPGVTRNEALKLAGNGVVPQQAEAALRFLLGVTEAAA